MNADSFYHHMRHGKDVNKSVYQAPPGVQEICEMGKYFQKLDIHNAAQCQWTTKVPANIEAYRVALPSAVPVCALATADNIPHAAMSGIQLDLAGRLYFTLPSAAADGTDSLALAATSILWLVNFAA